MQTAARAAWLVLVSLLVAAPASAFKPNEAGHLGITTDALTPIERTVDGETLQFSDHALCEIRDANRNVDIVTFFGVEQHFDDEAFQASTTRLLDLKESVISRITAPAPDGELAREDLGGALHTIQDFYSHSNWVELGQTAIENRLGRSTFDSLPGDVATCPSSPGTLGGAGLSSTTTGYFPFPDPCAGPPDGTPAGKCRHGVEFFCPEGLNKDAPDRVGFPSARTFAIDATVDYVNQILDDTRVAGNAAAIRALMAAGAANSATTGHIVMLTGKLGDERRDVAVPVDSSVTKLTFLLTVPARTRVNVLRPSGAVVRSSDPGVTMASTSTDRTITVQSPQAGSWVVRLRGEESRFTLDVLAESPLQLERFDFVTLTGRVGHEGFAPIAGEPAVGSTQTALAELLGSFGGATFGLISDKGKILRTASLSQGDENAGANEFVGSLTIPKKAFRAVVSGTDGAGVAYQRVLPRLYQPTS